jgi:hypothetical protein
VCVVEFHVVAVQIAAISHGVELGEAGMDMM